MCTTHTHRQMRAHWKNEQCYSRQCTNYKPTTPFEQHSVALFICLCVCLQFSSKKNASTSHAFADCTEAECESYRTEIDCFISIDLLIYIQFSRRWKKKKETLLTLFMSSFLETQCKWNWRNIARALLLLAKFVAKNYLRLLFAVQHFFRPTLNCRRDDESNI